MAFQDAVVKLLSEGLPLWQFFCLRSLLILPVLFLVIGRRGWRGLKLALAPWVLLRSGLIVAMYVCFYAALPLLDLSLVAAVYYTAPLFIVVFSAWILREPIRPSQALAVLLAFGGVLIVLQPTGDGFSLAALIPLISALCYAFAAIATRGPIRGIDAWTLTLSLNIVFALLGGLGIVVLLVLNPDPSYPFLLQAWSPLDWEGFGTLCLLAAASIAVHLCLARAYQLGPTAVVAGLDFSYLGFAILWSFIVFDTLPSLTAAVGTLLIGAAGLWSLLKPSGLAPGR